MDNIYTKTKVKLTALYFLIILAIVVFFSVVIINNQYSQFARIERFTPEFVNFNSQNYFQQNPGPNPGAFGGVVSDVKHNLLVEIIEADIFILLTSIILSYYLAIKTLKPIEETLEKQKKFVSNASHELKTPLTSIITEGEVLLRSERSNEEYKSFTQSVLQEAKRLSQLTIQLLNIAKYDNHKSSLNVTDFDIKKLLENEIGKFTSLAAEKNIVINKKFDNVELIINNDKEKVIQLIDIIIDNAIKYNKENGQVNVGLTFNQNQVIVSVKDTGIGISKEHIDKIFDRFYRVSSDRHDKGFGLGLYIAQEIINELNGSLTIRSKPGQYTVVEILL